jgi:hypothetical protein
MSLDLLRQIAFTGALRSWILELLPSSYLLYPVTGLHLQFDAGFLARIEEVLDSRLASQLLAFPPANQPEVITTARGRRHLFLQFAVDRFGTKEGAFLEQFIGWKERCQEMGYNTGSKPVVIVIDVDPLGETDWHFERPLSYEGFPIRYRPSPAAHGNIGPGSRITATEPTYGTFGGHLKDAVTLRNLAVTCAHVVGTPPGHVRILDEHDKAVSGRGRVVATRLPPIGGPCNMQVNPDAGVDAALIELDVPLQVQAHGSVTVGRIVEVYQDDPVVFNGAKSGKVLARVDAATIWKAVLIDGQRYCFADLFSIGHREPSYVLQAVSQPGDSGAWVLRDTIAPLSTWIGMVVAGDRQQNQSLACHAESVFAWSRSVNPNLVLP